MKRSIVFALPLLVLIIVVVLFVTRLNAQEYVTNLGQDYMDADSSWGNFEIIDTENMDSYVVLKIKYQTKADFVPKERWFIKDNVKLSESESGFPLWEGNVYLVRKGFFSWKEIR